jgi:imidazolonepropionase
MPRSQSLLLTNIGQLLTLRQPEGKPGPRRGAQLQELGIIKNAALLCTGGKIASVGSSKAALQDGWLKRNRKKIVEIDCGGKVVLPGFIDSHTHPVFTQPRLLDFEKRIAGATYEEIAKSGGGIRSSVEGVRKASKQQLAEIVLHSLEAMAEQGTTTVEAKSGYGLTVESELKSLEAIREATRHWPGTVVPTLLGAHVVPKEFEGRSAEYVALVCREMIPQVARRKLASFVDVFCERGAFSAAETEQIFAAAQQHKLGVRAHVGQLSQTSLSSLLEFSPASFDHVDHISDADIAHMARHSTVATLLPGVNFFLGHGKYPPARRLIEAEVPIALATDYNPGSSPTCSMPFVLSMACTQMGMSPAEAIAAATVNAGFALGIQYNKGTLEPGKDADLAAFEVKDYREIPYWLAANRCSLVVMNGSPFEIR